MASNLIITNKLSANATLYDLVAPASTYNGYILKMTTINTDGTYDSEANSAADDLGQVIVIQDPLCYEAEKTEDEYIIATGEIIRSVVPYIGMTISIPVANITATNPLVAGSTDVVPKAGAAKMENITAAAGTEAVIFKLDRLHTAGGVAMAEIRCTKLN